MAKRFIASLIPLSFVVMGGALLKTATPLAARAVDPVAARADTQRVAISVAGMFCESCEASVRTMLKRTKGVYSATVDVKRGLATVLYDPKETSPSALAEVINRLGYKATLPAPNKAG
jgi:copper chaperone CopZ